jgi:hypothetical protein
MRKSNQRASLTAIVPVTVALAALFATPMASAADGAKSSDAGAGCRQETRRVAVWPSGNPKIVSIVRFETKSVTICDGKVVANATDGREK